MDETYGTYVDDECFDDHHYNNDTDDDTNDNTDDDTDGGRGNLYTIANSETLVLDLVWP